MNAPRPLPTESSSASCPASVGEAAFNSPVISPDSAYEESELLSERRSKWLFRLQVCLILSLCAHIGMLYYMRDKVVEFVIRSGSDEAPDSLSPQDVPVRLPEVLPGYSESRLDSPAVEDSFEQLNPSAQVEQLDISDDRPQLDLNDINIPLEHEFQAIESPELSDASHLPEPEIQDLAAPEESVIQDKNIAASLQAADLELPTLIPEPESENSVAESKAPPSGSELGGMGILPADKTPVSAVVLKEGLRDIGNPVMESISTEDNSPLSIPSTDAFSDLPFKGISQAPPIRRPVPSRVSADLGKAPDYAINVSADASVPESQTTRRISEAPRGLPRASFDSASAYNEMTSVDISRSLLVDSPRPMPTNIPPSTVLLSQPNRSIEEIGVPETGVVSMRTPVQPRSISALRPLNSYSQRAPELRSELITRFGGDARISQSIENGLKYLAKTQMPDGRWCFHFVQPNANIPPSIQQNGELQCDTGATALALLAMLGAGYTHADGPYKEEIAKGLDFLLRNQLLNVVGANLDPNVGLPIYNKETDLHSGSRSYAHAMATIALCEAYGLTQDKKYLPAAENAVRYIISTQNQRLGGWRYESPDGFGKPHEESDTSSTGWQVMALRSALAAKVLPAGEIQPSLARVQKWLDKAVNSKTGRFMYNPYEVRGESEIDYADWNKTTPAMTAEGLFIQKCIAPEKSISPQLISYLMENAPGRKNEDGYQRDVYYWYYATALQFAQGGDSWLQWQSMVMPYLRDSQMPINHPLGGSWSSYQISNKQKVNIDKWSNLGGRHYVTCMSLMIMEIYARHLTIYQ